MYTQNNKTKRQNGEFVSSDDSELKTHKPKKNKIHRFEAKTRNALRNVSTDDLEYLEDVDELFSF